MVRCGCCNKLMRYTYSQTMSQYFYTCRRCKTRTHLDDLKLILVEDIKAQITKINDIEVIAYNEKNIKRIKRDINDFIIDNDKYVKKVENKLAKIKGAKCFVINLVKRNDALIKQNIGETVVQVPYLINGETGTVNEEFIEQMQILI